MQEQGTTKVSVWPLVIAGTFFVVILAFFVIEFVGLSGDDGGLEDESVTAESYLDEVMPLLVGADATRGAELVDKHGCIACHGNQNLAPDYAVTRQQAGDRRPPMQPIAYVYESILHPGAFVVEGYMNNMPRTFSSLSGRDLGDIIAFITGVTVETTAEPNVEATAESTAEASVEATAESTVEQTAEPTLTVLTQAMIDEYKTSAEFLVVGGDAARGPQLMEEYGCNVCHGSDTAGIVAPHLVDLEIIAETMRPPLSETAYIYESILYPAHYILEGWPDLMPKNFSEVISVSDLGDLIAYLRDRQSGE